MREQVDVSVIFAEHHVGLVRLALIMVGDQATAEDVVQEAFARTHAGRGRLRDPGRGAGLRALRRAQRVPVGAASAGHGVPAGGAVRTARLVGGERRDGDARSAARCFWRCAELPRRQREALTLRYYLGLADQEIAETMRISASTVRSTIARGLAALAPGTWGGFMNSPMEDRLREALAEAGATVDTSTLQPLHGAWRSRFRVDLRLVAVAAVVVLVGVAGAVGLGGRGDVDRAVAVNPDQRIDKGEMIVFLCSKTLPKEAACQGRDVTAEETKAVGALVRQLPEVESVTFIDQASAYENFRRDFVHNKALLDGVGAVDLPASFRLTIRDGGRSGSGVTGAARGGGDPECGGTCLLPWSRTCAGARSEIRAFLCGKEATRARVAPCEVR